MGGASGTQSAGRRTRRALIGGGLAAAGMGALPACAGGGGAAGGAAGGGQPLARDATVRYMTNSDPQSLAGTQEIVGLFAAVQPRVRVEAEPTGFNDIPAKLTATAAAGTPPDGAQCTYPGMVGLAAAGALLALEPYTRRDTAFDFADIFPAYAEASRYKGTLYAISVEGGPWVAFYNQS